MQTPESRRSTDSYENPHFEYSNEHLGLSRFIQEGWKRHNFSPDKEYAIVTSRRAKIPIAHLDRQDPAKQMVVIGTAFKDMKEPDTASFAGDDNDRLRMGFIFDATSKVKETELMPVALVRVFQGEQVRYDKSNYTLLFAPQTRWIQFRIAEDVYLKDDFTFDRKLTYAYIDAELNKPKA